MIGGGVGAFVGLLGVLLVGNDASVCASGLGQFAQAVSPQSASTCSVDGGINFISWVLLVGGALTAALGLFAKPGAPV